MVIRADKDTAYHLHTTPHLVHCERMVWAGSTLAIMDDDLNVTLPVWDFAIPLTLLSAFLLLWKSQKQVSASHDPGL